MAFLKSVDGVGFLPDEKQEKIREIGNYVYKKADGEEIPYLTEWEVDCLTIQKGTLTAEERSTMENHVVMTGKILDKVHFNIHYGNVAKIATRHHEYLDGSGYPNHLIAENLDVESRILTIVDIYDALTSVDRPYKKPMPKEKAFGILRAMVGEGKLDGQLVDWLEEALEDH